MTTHERINRLRIEAIKDLEEERLYSARDKLTIAIEIYEANLRYSKEMIDYV